MPGSNGAESTVRGRRRRGSGGERCEGLCHLVALHRAHCLESTSGFMETFDVSVLDFVSCLVPPPRKTFSRHRVCLRKLLTCVSLAIFPSCQPIPAAHGEAQHEGGSQPARLPARPRSSRGAALCRAVRETWSQRAGTPRFPAFKLFMRARVAAPAVIATALEGMPPSPPC